MRWLGTIEEEEKGGARKRGSGWHGTELLVQSICLKTEEKREACVEGLGVVLSA